MRGDLTQTDLAKRLGKGLRTLARWEGLAEVPPHIVAIVEAGLAGQSVAPSAVVAKGKGAPKVAKVPAVKVKGATLEEISQAARAERAALEPRPEGVLNGARRPTDKERAEFPARYSGPDVWVTVFNPPWKLATGQTITRVIQKGSATGAGGYSQHLLGSNARGSTDREALPPGVYRPFVPSCGIAATPGTGPKVAKGKALR
jgi:hypothetical protein